MAEAYALESHEHCRRRINRSGRTSTSNSIRPSSRPTAGKQYLAGMGTTLYVTVIAILIGIVLGVIVASIRTAHDQQRRKKNIFLAFQRDMQGHM